MRRPFKNDHKAVASFKPLDHAYDPAGGGAGACTAPQALQESDLHRQEPGLAGLQRESERELKINQLSFI